MEDLDKSTINRARSEAYQKYIRDMMNRMQGDAEKSNAPSSESAIHFFEEAHESEVAFVEFFEKENARRHNTYKYSLVHNQEAALVIRRGQPFKMAVNLRGNYNPGKDGISLEFNFGHRPNVNKGSQVLLEVEDKTEFSVLSAQWDVRLESVSGGRVMLQVQVPPTVGIGVWTLTVNVTPNRRGAATRKNKLEKKNIYVLFNPWCTEDTVYLKNDEWKEEYINNDVGKLYYGSYMEYSSRRWIYGQFQVASLPTAMFLLDLSGLVYNARANPVRVSRAISNMMNKAANIPGDTGVLVGKWGKKKDDYRDGRAPGSWTGSAPILEQFLRSNGKPVRYGQCWVFAGVCTTVCRTLGIPARNVSCFVAGHDTDETMTIDITYDQYGNRVSNSSDSIWNFHVWTEVWMSRLDLPAGYGGWQVIDGTPQEISDGTYQVGPCPVLGVKRGQVGLQYDTLFVFSEVNADMVSWTMRKDGQGFEKSSVSTDHIGRLLITKKVGEYDDLGDDDIEELTGTYKYKEGTAEERMAVLNAARSAGKSQLFDMPEPDTEELAFELEPVTNVMAGEDFEISLNIENRGEMERTVMVVLSCCSVLYTGIIAHKVVEKKKVVTVSPDQKMQRETRWKVYASEYIDLLVEFGMMKIYCMATVPETNQTWAGEKDFHVKKPKIVLDLPSVLRRSREYALRIIFKNPLPKLLTGCMFAAEGTGLIESTQENFRDIEGKEEVEHIFTFTPYYKCQTAMVVVFGSNELSGITGSKQVTVK